MDHGPWATRPLPSLSTLKPTCTGTFTGNSTHRHRRRYRHRASSSTTGQGESQGTRPALRPSSIPQLIPQSESTFCRVLHLLLTWVIRYWQVAPPRVCPRIVAPPIRVWWWPQRHDPGPSFRELSSGAGDGIDPKEQPSKAQDSTSNKQNQKRECTQGQGQDQQKAQYIEYSGYTQDRTKGTIYTEKGETTTTTKASYIIHHHLRTRTPKRNSKKIPIIICKQTRDPPTPLHSTIPPPPRC
jgi:hypothetical protein